MGLPFHAASKRIATTNIYLGEMGTVFMDEERIILTLGNVVSF